MNLAQGRSLLSSGVEQAARAIVDLINSRPNSPRPDEIAEIIDKLAVPDVATRSCPNCTNLDREYGPIISRP